MVATRGKKIKFDLDNSEAEFDEEMDVERPGKRAAKKRRKTKTSKSGEGDRAFTLGSSSVKRKGKTTLVQNQLVIQRSGRGGKLRDLMNMPVDIFTEICSYLGPYDLRRLALTSKRLWDILMTKEARHIWKAALASVSDIPECPTDLNEPQYVCLLYSSECYAIGCTSRGTKANWFHRVRFCSTCYKSKMAGGWTHRQRQSSLSQLGIEEDTLSQIQDYFDSRRLLPSDSFRLSYHSEALKKAASEYEALSGEEAGEFILTLKRGRDYKIETGRAMMKWKDKQISSREKDIAAEKHARFESIEAKLVELGWERRDFPMSKKEFRDLVLKDQKLTPKVWRNIKWKLEQLLDESRKERLEKEKRERRSVRKSVICEFYHQTARETMGKSFQGSSVGSILPDIEEVLTLPSVKPLLESDTETVTEDQWVEAAPDVRYIVVKWWRDVLELLVDSLEHGATAQPSDIGNRDNGKTVSNSENDAEEAILSSTNALRTKLSSATAFFCCKNSSCKDLYRFPHSIKHALSFHSCSSMSELLSQMQPLDFDGQDLARRLLKDLNLDPETVQLSDVVFEDPDQKNFLCTRCDERIARYMDLDQLIEHYIQHQTWFNDATEAVRTSPASCYPSRAVTGELPKIVNDHDWLSRDALLARQDNSEKKQSVLNLQRDFQREKLSEPFGDSTMSDPDWDFFSQFFADTRTCSLCPRAYAPQTSSTRVLALHIRSKHDKVPDLEHDTALGSLWSLNPCPV